MLMNEFSEGNFKPRTKEQLSLFEEFIKFRLENGYPSKFTILRNLAKTRHYTKTIYPPNWKIS